MAPQTLTSKKLRVGLLSLGCPKTLVDSELVLGKLDPGRYLLSDTVTRCDIAVLNTCAFIQDAQQESIDQILRLIELKKEGEIKKIVVLGCLTQRFLPALQTELKEVDAFVGTGEYSKIPEILERVGEGQGISTVGTPGYLYTSGEKRVSLTPHFYRYLKISEGCDHTCAFCVIPQFRGKHRSRSLDDVVKEAEQLVKEGARELILTGQDTTFFGYDLHGRYLLPELLRRLNAIPKLRWLRVLYAYPSLVTDELIEALATLGKVCHYLDMPLQHINDKILKSMRRGTTRDATRRLIKKLRARIPDLAIRTTFIVGYPGETEKEFRELLDFMEEAHFERLGIFTYSQEEGSPAGSLPGQIPEKTKRRRLEEGMLLQQKISRENNSRLIGKTLEILVEGRDEAAQHWFGRTFMDAPEVDGRVVLRNPALEIASRGFAAPEDVSAPPPRNNGLKAGAWVSAQITETEEYDLVGQIVSRFES